VLVRDALEFAPGVEDTSFMQSLLNNILKKQDELDKIIEKAAPDWPLDKISIIDRNILRIGLHELLFADRDEVPAKVAINEAIELAKTFGGENSGKFINGVLGSVYKEIGEPGKDAVPRGIKVIRELPTERLAGAVVFSRNNGDTYLALVHDVFGHWTLSKGHLNEDEQELAGVKRVIKEEIGLSVKPLEKLGQNEYIASQPDKGKIRKQVTYFLAESSFKEVKLAKGGGLDDAKWFKLSEILELNFYNDILPIVTKAINLLVSDNK